MPKKTTSIGEIGLWHLRIHYGEYNLGHLLEFIRARCDMLICVKEVDANRPHIHCVITKFRQTMSTFRQQLVKEFPHIVGNKSYSLNVKDDVNAQVRYCCKGENKDATPDVLYVRDDIDVKSNHDKYWENNAILVGEKKEVNMGCQNGSSLVLKAKSKTWTEKVYEELVDKYQPEINIIQTHQLLIKPNDLEIKSYNEARFVIYKHMLLCLGKARKKINDFIKKDLYNGFINSIISENDEAFAVYAHADFKKLILVG